MIALVIIGIVIFAGLIVALAAALYELYEARGRLARHDRSWWEQRKTEVLMIHLADESTIQGVVLEIGPDGVLLGAPEYLGEERRVELAGEVWIPREQIVMVQVPPRTATAPRRIRRAS